MDAYFPKTRRPTNGLSTPVKRPPPSITPPKAAKIPAPPSTPKDARLKRPTVPPPLKTKAELKSQQPPRRRPISVRELFKSAHSSEPDDKNDGDTSVATKAKANAKDYHHNDNDREDRITQITTKSTSTSKLITTSPNKISSGPLKGISTSLLEHIRAKEAAASTITPEQRRTRELLGIAPELIRIVSTLFTANRKTVMLHDKVIDKCFRGLNSNYTTQTIMDCLKLMDRVAPEWTSTVSISRGVFMKINRDKYTIPQLLQAIKSYKYK